MFTTVAEYWMQRAHEAIPTGYEKAIENYRLQKENFLKRLEQESGLEVQNFLEQVNNEVFKEVNVELDQTFEEAFSQVREYVEKYIIELMQEGVAGYDQLLSRFSDLVEKGKSGEVDPNNLYKNLVNDINNFLAVNDITKSGLARYVSSLNNTSNADIQNNLFGYARKLILMQLQGQGLNYSTQHYKTSLKGYWKEKLLVPALNRVLEQYGYVASQYGSALNEKGYKSQYDIVLGSKGTSSMSDDLLGPLVKQMEGMSRTISSTSSVTTQGEFLLGGLQSKSWIAPWADSKIKGNRNFLSFGHNAALMPKGKDARYWHAGVFNVMNNLTTAIGPSNFMFSTGDQIYWTADLLAQFQQYQYVLAFYYNKKEGKIVSSNISAQPHDC